MKKKTKQTKPVRKAVSGSAHKDWKQQEFHWMWLLVVGAVALVFIVWLLKQGEQLPPQAPAMNAQEAQLDEQQMDTELTNLEKGMDSIDKDMAAIETQEKQIKK